MSQGSGPSLSFPPPLGLPQRSADWSARVGVRLAFRLRRACPDGATTGQLELACGVAGQSPFRRGEPGGDGGGEGRLV